MMPTTTITADGAAKTCADCRQVLGLECFRRRSRNSKYYATYCTRCHNSRSKKTTAQNTECMRKYRERHPARYARYKLRNRVAQYGLSFDAYTAMLTACGNRCQICGAPGENEKCGRLHIDHCHRSGQARGLLCMLCNIALGAVDDDIARLRAAILYLTPKESPRA